MIQINFQHYIELARTFIYSIGGPAFIIIGLSSFIGNYLSKSRLESLQSKYRLELEKTKSQLEQARSQFFRYSEKQFDLYNSLWKVLIRTKMLADSLWENASPKKLPAFSEQIRLTRQAVMDNMLLIEEDHYDKLDKLVGDFEKFMFGKTKLIEIRTTSQGASQSIPITQGEVTRTINDNRQIKNKYNKLIMEIGKSFRDQIKG